VETLLGEEIENPRQQPTKASLHGQELVDQALEAIKQQKMLGKAVTGETISQLVGIPWTTLSRYLWSKMENKEAAQEQRLKYIREGSLRAETVWQRC
jgi:TolB-like protein